MKAGDQIEDQVGRGKSFALHIGTHGAQDGGDGGADVGADRQCERILIGDLLRSQRGDNDNQRGMTRLHDHGSEDTDCSENEDPWITGNRKGAQVDGVTKGLKALFHVVDAKEQETESGQDVADALERFWNPGTPG